MLCMGGEIWLPVRSYGHDENYRNGVDRRYSVSNHGRIRSRSMWLRTSRGDGRQRRPGQMLKTRPMGSGYAAVDLVHQGLRKSFYVHRLVALAFLGDAPEGFPHVRHLDGDPLNNRPGNLAWGNPKQNAEDRTIHGTENSGERNGCAKLTWEDVAQIRGATGTQRVIAARFGISQGQVSRIRLGQCWRPT